MRMSLIASRQAVTEVSRIRHCPTSATYQNLALHFHLAIESGGKASSQSYDDAEFAYVPLLDENRDSQLLEILPDYLTEEICFPRNNAAKFYSKIAECLTKRIVDE